MPTTEQEWKKIAKDFEVTWNFPHCLGALDGKHVVMQCPANTGSTFYNYKGTFSIVLMALVDANYNFIYAHVGCQGRISDGGVFNATPFSSLLYQDKLSIPNPEPLSGRIIPTPYVIVADEAFPLKENIMKPYPGSLQQSPRRIFNYRLSRARRVVENTFGLLCSVFRLFRKPLCLNVKNAEVVVTACIYLHNFLLHLYMHLQEHLTEKLPMDYIFQDLGEQSPQVIPELETYVIFLEEQLLQQSEYETNIEIIL
jgi:hypothetical protein